MLITVILRVQHSKMTKTKFCAAVDGNNAGAAAVTDGDDDDEEIMLTIIQKERKKCCIKRKKLINCVPILTSFKPTRSVAGE